MILFTVAKFIKCHVFEIRSNAFEKTKNHKSEIELRQRYGTENVARTWDVVFHEEEGERAEIPTLDERV